MFINHDIIAHAFRLINFVVIIGIFYFLFQKYVKSNLYALIAEKKAVQESLHTLQMTLEKEQSNLDSLLKEDAALCQKFKSAIDEWDQIVIRDHDAQEKKHALLATAINKRAATIAVNTEGQRIQNLVAQHIVVDLENNLLHHFTSQQHNDEYINALVHFMNERSSS